MATDDNKKDKNIEKGDKLVPAIDYGSNLTSTLESLILSEKSSNSLRSLTIRISYDDYKLLNKLKEKLEVKSYSAVCRIAIRYLEKGK
jgi:hypothetical protein